MSKQSKKSKSNKSKNYDSNVKTNEFITPPNIFYILLVSFCVSAILIGLIDIKKISNIFQLYFIT